MSPVAAVAVGCLFVLSSSSYVRPSHALQMKNDTCVWYGESEYVKGMPLNSPYNGLALPMTDPESLQILQTWCPDFVQDYTKDGNILHTCCNKDQLMTLSTSIVQAANFLHRCPSCMRTFGRFICEMVCSPKQSRFMRATKWSANGSSIRELEFYIADSYMQGVYDSCKSVSNPATGELAMDMICAGVMSCSAHKWFRFLGNNSYLAFIINFIPFLKANDDFELFRAPVTPCNRAADNDTIACSCMDCEESCPLPDVMPETPKPFSMFGMDVLTVSSTVLFCFVISIFASFVFFKDVLKNRSKRKIEKRKYIIADATKSKPKNVLETIFYRLGKFFASRMQISFLLAICLITTLSHGIHYTKLTINPVDLWSSPNSQCRQEREYFNSNFKPFFRTTQVIIAPTGIPNVDYKTAQGIFKFGPVFNHTFLLEVQKLQEQIESLGSPGNGLENVCFAPLRSTFSGPPAVTDCVVQSVWGYFGNTPYRLNRKSINPDGTPHTYLDHLKFCFQNPYRQLCLAPYGGPVDPSVALGGFSNFSESITNSVPYEKATSLLLTFVLNNHNNKSLLRDALDWESKFLEFMKNWTENAKPSYMDVAYFAERSVEDELDRESHSDVSTIAVSYLVMFVYIVFTLGPRKIMLSFVGIVLIVASVVCSVGFYGLIGVPLSLIVLEVVPFVVLAVGVDNMFLIVRTYQQTNAHDDNGETAVATADHVGRVFGEIGPSVFIATLAETACFFIGSLSDMPVVRAFALYAAAALVFNFFFQVTCLAGLLALDAKRGTTEKSKPVEQGFVYDAFQKLYVPALMNKFVRPLVVLVFTAWLCASIVVGPKIDVGLDVELTMTDDSYVLKYFQFMKRYFSTGPPVYFVVTDGLNLSAYDDQNLLCGGVRCDPYSVANQIHRASKTPGSTYINRPATSWIDDYFDWAALPGCCKYYPLNDSFCPHAEYETCELCDINKNDWNRPDARSFLKFLPYFLQDNPDQQCSKAGHAAYGDAVQLHDNSTGASYFMTYHTVLKTSRDYYKSMRSARAMADNMTETIRRNNPNSNAIVFPYSVFYVFYEQYLTVWEVCAQHLMLSLATVTFVMWSFTNLEISSALTLLLVNIMITVDLLAFMYYWDISLNAISLVNIVMSIGIMVEFCGHIIYHNSKSNVPCPVQRAAHSCVNVGSSVFSGITLTKFAGLAVLGFANTPVFKIFYYKMYMGIVVIAALHGLVFLPVLLSYKGYTTVKKIDSKKAKNCKLQLLEVNVLR